MTCASFYLSISSARPICSLLLFVWCRLLVYFGALFLNYLGHRGQFSIATILCILVFFLITTAAEMSLIMPSAKNLVNSTSSAKKRQQVAVNCLTRWSLLQHIFSSLRKWMHTINKVELMDSLSRSMESYPKTSVVEPTMFILQDTLPNYVD